MTIAEEDFINFLIRNGDKVKEIIVTRQYFMRLIYLLQSRREFMGTFTQGNNSWQFHCAGVLVCRGDR